MSPLCREPPTAWRGTEVPTISVPLLFHHESFLLECSMCVVLERTMDLGLGLSEEEEQQIAALVEKVTHKIDEETYFDHPLTEHERVICHVAVAVALWEITRSVRLAARESDPRP